MQNMSCKIYMDHAATTEMLPQVRKAMEPYLMEEYGNASTSYEMGRRTREALEGAREQIAMLIKAKPEEIFFTSGGSESDNWVIKNVAAEKKEKGKHVITSKIEHHAVLRSCEYLEKLGYELTYLDVDAYGVIDLAQLREVLREDTTLVSVMTGNNEIGTIEPLDAVASMLRGTGTLFHTDAVQAVGHIPVDVQELGIDALSLSAHKFHGPRGVGALYLRKGFSIPPLITGGAQERGERAGTENVAGIVGMVTALEEACETLRSDILRISSLRNELIRHLLGEVEDMALTGTPIKYASADGTKTPCTPACDASALPDRNAPVSRATDGGATGEPSAASDGEALDRSPSIGRLPSIASFTCDDVDGELLVVLLDRAGVAAATGSACSTGSTEPSHVLTAMGIPAQRARGALRLSLASDITAEDVTLLSKRIPACIRKARLISSIR